MRSAVRTVVGVAGRAPWSAGCGSPALRVRARRRPARTAGSGQVGSRPSVARLADLERRVGVLVLAGPLAASGPRVAGSWSAGSWRSGAGPGVDGSGVGGLGCSWGAGGSRDAGSSWGSWGAGAASGRSGGVAGGVGACPAAGRVVGRGRVAGPAGAWRTGAGRAGTRDAGAWPVGAWPADPLAEARVAGVGGPYARVSGARVAGPGVAGPGVARARIPGARRTEPRVAGSRPVRSWPAGSWRSGAGPGVDGSGVDGSGVDGSGAGGLGCSWGAGGSRDAGSSWGSWGSWGAGAASGRSGGVARGVGACPAAGRVVGRGRVAGPAGAGRAGTRDAGAWPVGAWPADPLAEARVAGVGGPYARVSGARVAGPRVAGPRVAGPGVAGPGVARARIPGARRTEPRVAGSRPVRSWPAGSWRPEARPRVGGTWGARAGTGRHVAWCAGIPAGRAGHAAGITRGVGAELATGRVVRRRRSGCPVGPGSLPWITSAWITSAWITSAWITRARIADSRIARAGICAAGVCASRACVARVRAAGVRVPGIGVPGIGRPGVSHPRAVGSGAGVSWCPGAGVGGSRLAGTDSGIDSPRIARRAGSAVPPAGGARDSGSGFQPGMPLVTSRLIVAATPAVEPLRPGRAAAASRQVRVGAGAEAPGIVVAMRGWSLIRGDPSRHPGGRQPLIRLRSRTARIGRTAVGGRPELVPRLSVVTVLIAVHRPVWLARAVRSAPTVLVPGIGTAALRVAGVGVGHSGPIPRSGPVHWRSSPGRAEA